MNMLNVKAKPDRRAYFEGRIIPNDAFIPVPDTPYIRRLILHWEDLEVEGGIESLKGSKTSNPKDKSASQPTKPRPPETNQ